MTGMEIFTLLISSGMMMAILVIVFRTGRIVQKIEAIETRLESVDKKIDAIGLDIKSLTSRIDRVEVRVEERT